MPTLPVPLIESVTVNGGVAQRSRVTLIDVKLDRLVDPITLADAFQLVRLSDFAVRWPETTIYVANGKSGALLTFDDVAGCEFGSLPDGQWGLKFTPSIAVIPRLFGDLNGDGTVDITDLSAFMTALGSSQGQANYLPAADWDQTNDIGAIDHGEFLKRFGKSVGD